MTAGGIITGLASLYGGITAYSNSLEMASLLEEQGALVQGDYNRQAALVRDAGYRTKQKQLMEFVSSGVEIQGTPLLVLRETGKKAEAVAGSYEFTGQQYSDLYKKKAKITKSEGKAELISSILAAGASVL